MIRHALTLSGLVPFLLLAAPLIPVHQEDGEEINEPNEHERLALDWLRVRDHDEWEYLQEGVDDEDEEAWYELKEKVEELDFLLEEFPESKELLLRYVEHEERADELTDAYFEEPGPEAEVALREVLRAWIDVRLDLQECWWKLEHINHADELAEIRSIDPRELAGFWLEGALGAAGPQWIEALLIEEAEAWAEAMEEVDPELSEWWFDLIATDPGGIEPTFTAWRERDPEQFEAVREAGRLGIGLMKNEVALNKFVYENDLPRDGEGQMAETIDRAIAGDEWPELSRILAALVRYDLQIKQRDHAWDGEELAEDTAEVAKRREGVEVIVTTELMRRTDRGYLLTW